MNSCSHSNVTNLPFAFGGPGGAGLIRAVPDDFQVDEITAVVPAGSGEHCLLHIEKRGANTEWVAGLLARHAGVPRRDVGYAGLKDRHAVTRQWFSVRLAGRPEPDWKALETPSLRLLEAVRHNRKLRIGALRGNRFRIRVRQLTADREALELILTSMARYGLPNYFGEQRFGHGQANLEGAKALFSGERKRVKRKHQGLYLSAARALLFNQVLARRVIEDSWRRPLDGERFLLAGSRSSFLAEQIDHELQDRCASMDIHPSGPLWGRGELGTAGAVARLETETLQADEYWKRGLEDFGLKLERRALRMPVEDLEWSVEQNLLTLGFSLPKGSFATVLLRECMDYHLPGNGG